MSDGKVHHGDQPRGVFNHPKAQISDSEDDINFAGNSGRTDSNENFELKDISHGQRISDNGEPSFDPEFEDWQSEDEKSPDFSGTRRASASTVQSFMLYTPDEERSVVRKFDRKLVLFVAFLYMLSFLDRSSMH